MCSSLCPGKIQPKEQVGICPVHMKSLSILAKTLLGPDGVDTQLISNPFKMTKCCVSREKMHRCCCLFALTGTLFLQYASEFLHWALSQSYNCSGAPVKQPWRLWLRGSQEFIKRWWHKLKTRQLVLKRSYPIAIWQVHPQQWYRVPVKLQSDAKRLTSNLAPLRLREICR